MIWQHLLFPDTDHWIVCRDVFEVNEFKSYDPFPGGLGSPVGKLVRIRAFLSPPLAGWRRVFITDTIPDDLIQQIAQKLPVALLNILLLSADDYQITVFHPNQPASSELSALTPFLQVGKTLPSQHDSQPTPSDDANLPPELQQFAQSQGVKGKHVDKMMGRLSKSILKKIAGDEHLKDQATASLSAQHGVDWKSPAAQHLKAIMASLTVPTQWHLPDWKTLVSAYQIARQKKSGGLVLPGDEAVLRQVPDALDFVPLYYAKKQD